MKRLLIFENEFREVEPAFKAVNMLYYNNTLEFKVCVSSQAFGPLSDTALFDSVLVDLDLSLKSELDGYSLIKRILEVNNTAKIMILSGASEDKIVAKLEEKGLPRVPIINKPVDFDDLYQKLKTSGV